MSHDATSAAQTQSAVYVQPKHGIATQTTKKPTKTTPMIGNSDAANGRGSTVSCMATTDIAVPVIRCFAAFVRLPVNSQGKRLGLRGLDDKTQLDLLE